MRLIDADSLLANMNKGIQGTAREYLKFFQMAVNYEPTSYDVDKVVEQFKGMRDTSIRNIELNSQGDVYEEMSEAKRHYQMIIQTVKSGGIE